MLPNPSYWSPVKAARFLLHYHGLLAPCQGVGKEAVLSYLSRVGCIQFDPLNVCGRNADLVLQSRIKDYSPSLLEELLYKDRLLMDGWDKMMAIFPVTDFPRFRRTREQITVSYLRRYPDVKEHLKDYLDTIRSDGPLSSLDFNEDRKMNWAWGSTRLARAALEALFFSGQTSIHHREGSRRYFDLSERLLSPEIRAQEDPHRDLHSYRFWHAERRIRSAGIAGFGIRDFWHGIAESDMKEIRRAVDELIDLGRIQEIRIEGSARDWFIPANQPEEPSAGDDGPAVLLAPLDNMLWNRELIELLFGFRYRWEVYTPASKREYGYYVLPVLHRGRIIARCEPVLDRKARKLVLKGFWFEEKTVRDDQTITALKEMFASFCRFHGVKRMVTSPGLGRDVRRLFTGITSS